MESKMSRKVKCARIWLPMLRISHVGSRARISGIYRAFAPSVFLRSSERITVMAGKNIAVFGIYPSRAAAEEAVDALEAAGFRAADISVLMSENRGTKDFAIEKGTKAPEGVATGATSGIII